jgi:uncharacterized membrane protein YtjA (UPF0391 family)
MIQAALGWPQKAAFFGMPRARKFGLRHAPELGGHSKAEVSWLEPLERSTVLREPACQPPDGSTGCLMLKWAFIFLVISLIAGALGFTGVARGAATIAKVLFALFLILFVIFVILGLTVFSVAT